MQELRVPQRKVEVRVLLHGGEERSGVLYTALSNPEGRPGRLVDRLDDDAEAFLPFARDGRRELLHKSWVVWIRVDGEESHDEEATHAERLSITLAGGATVQGDVRYVMPPQRERLLDYLNAAPQFLPVRDAGTTTLVNRDFIVSVEGGQESQTRD